MICEKHAEGGDCEESDLTRAAPKGGTYIHMLGTADRQLRALADISTPGRT